MSAQSVTRLAHRSLIPTTFIHPPISSKAAAGVVISRGMSSTASASGQEGAPPGAPANPKDASQVRGHISWVKGVTEVSVALHCSLFWVTTADICIKKKKKKKKLSTKPQELIGTITGAETWKQSGLEDKARAVHEMRLAKEEGDRQAQYDKRSPAVLNVEGTGEKVAGIVVGCGGMKERGDEKKHAAKAKST